MKAAARDAQRQQEVDSIQRIRSAEAYADRIAKEDMDLYGEVSEESIIKGKAAIARADKAYRNSGVVYRDRKPVMAMADFRSAVKAEQDRKASAIAAARQGRLQY